MNDMQLIQSCKDFYRQFCVINENKHAVGYKESILKMFNILDSTVYVNLYKANGLDIEGTIGTYEINKEMSFDSITEDFDDLAAELLYDYYLLNSKNDSLKIEEFIDAIQDELYA